MNNNINVSHSNGVTIVYTEGPLAGGDDDYGWRQFKAAMWILGTVGLVVILIDGTLVPLLAWTVAAAVSAWLAVTLGKAVLREHRRQQAAIAEIAARADVQHAALMRGDMEVGLFGIYPVQKLNTVDFTPPDLYAGELPT